MGDSLSRRGLLRSAALAAGGVAALPWLEKLARAQASASPSGRPFRILAIDGGGIRGIIPAKILTYLEALAGQPACNLFDLIVGTSIGGILSVGLTLPGPSGGPRYSAANLLDMFLSDAGQIFQPFGQVRTPTLLDLFAPPPQQGEPESWFRAITTCKYSGQGIQNFLVTQMGEGPIGAALTRTATVSFDTQLQRLFQFRSWTGRTENYSVVQASRATSAAPLYFPVYQLPGGGGSGRYLIDGGVAANNPALVALSNAVNILLNNPGTYPDGVGTGLLVVSIGTGKSVAPLIPVPLPRDTSFPNWGVIPWLEAGLIEAMFDGPVAATGDAVDNALPPDAYFRFQPPLSGTTPVSGVSYTCSTDLDDWTASNLSALQTAGQWAIETWGDQMANAVGQLTAS